MAKILLVDDDAQALESMERILTLSGMAVVTARDGQEALDRVRQEKDWDAVVTDVRMPRMNGMEFLQALTVVSKEIPVILMSAFGRVEDAVWAMKLGAVDFLSKPFKRQVILSAIEAALKRNQGRKMAATSQWIGVSPEMTALKEMVSQVARADISVLVSGESGSGKELIARAIHEGSPRAHKKFIAVNCGAIPETLLESELFGHERGAFSGAVSHKEGLFAQADGGTLFLDEVGELPLSSQVKLLRALQEGEIRPVGSTQTRKVDVRVVSASNRDLKAFVSEGRFREDLLFRLEVVSIRVPSLRERMEDIGVLALHFLKDATSRFEREIEGFSEEASQWMSSYSWPGNVRELRNVVERAVIFCRGHRIEVSDLPDSIRQAPRSSEKAIRVPIGTPLREVEDLMIQKTLEATGGDKNVTARILGINSRTIYRRLEKQEPRES